MQQSAVALLQSLKRISPSLPQHLLQSPVRSLAYLATDGASGQTISHQSPGLNQQAKLTGHHIKQIRRRRPLVQELVDQQGSPPQPTLHYGIDHRKDIRFPGIAHQRVDVVLFNTFLSSMQR